MGRAPGDKVLWTAPPPLAGMAASGEDEAANEERFRASVQRELEELRLENASLRQRISALEGKVP